MCTASIRPQVAAMIFACCTLLDQKVWTTKDKDGNGEMQSSIFMCLKLLDRKQKAILSNSRDD
jgi:hypothetical protein